MAQKHGFRVNPTKIIISLIILGGLAYSLYRVVPRETAEIFVVSEPLTYGETSVTGILRKDSPVGEPGLYILAESTGRAIILDIADADPMIGLDVTVSGFLTPAVDSASLPVMTVSEMRSN